jgi:anti-sigma B factor antagonist
MEFNIGTDAVDGSAIIRVGGELDIYTAPRLRSALEDAMLQPQVRIVLDLCHVQFIDSTALGVLAYAFERAQAQQRDLRLVLDDPYLLKMFRITGFDNVFAIYPTIDEALAPPS